MAKAQGTLYIGTQWYDVDSTKLTSAKDIAELLTALEMRVSPTCKNFDKVKKYLIVPEQPKTLDEISQELGEKFDKLAKKTHLSFTESYLWSYNLQKYKDFGKTQDADFEHAKEHGQFPRTLRWVTGGRVGVVGDLDGAYLVSNGSFLSSPRFEIRAGYNHQGYYTLGGDGYYRFYMEKKPNAIFRFFVKKCMGFRWVDEA